MKNFLRTIILSLLYFSSYSQETLQSVTDRGSGTSNEITIKRTLGNGSIRFQDQAGSDRFSAYLAAPGGDFGILRHNDAGNNLGASLFIQRSSGNVGLGSTDIKPSRLTVRDYISSIAIVSDKNTEAMANNEAIGGIEFYKHYGIGNAAAIRVLQGGGYDYYSHAHLAFYTCPGGNVFTATPSEQMRITSSGNVGIGITSPNQKLQVQGIVKVTPIEGPNSAGVAKLMLSNDYDSDNSITHTSNRGIGLEVAGSERMRINPDGNVGIGTNTPAEKLSVNGKVRAQEIKVETSNWPDYVFEPSYSPRPLLELEIFIKENKHLPEIPSAKEVAENGVSLGEMNAKLLKKIEELTLYVIELRKDSEKQQKEIDKLKHQK